MNIFTLTPTHIIKHKYHKINVFLKITWKGKLLKNYSYFKSNINVLKATVSVMGKNMTEVIWFELKIKTKWRVMHLGSKIYGSITYIHICHIHYIYYIYIFIYNVIIL
jgi:hypothetical protein